MATWALCEICDQVIPLVESTTTPTGYRCADTIKCARIAEIKEKDREDDKHAPCLVCGAYDGHDEGCMVDPEQEVIR